MLEKKKGFTLVEIMVVMAIIAVLATLIIGAIQLARTTATETAQRSNAKTIQTALEANYAKYRAYCGNTGGINCAPHSLDEAATHLGVSLSKSINTSVAKCVVTTGNRAGGGAITSLSSGSYVIHTANAACNDWTSFEDVLQVNMTPQLTTTSWNVAPTYSF